MIIIGARFRKDVNNAGAGPAHFGGEFVGCNLKLAHAVLREVHQRTAHHLIIIVSTIDGDVAATPKSPRRRYLQRVGLGRVEVGGGAIAWNEKGKL